jgi:CHAD domain-containing protein
MNLIIENYNSLVRKYKKIEREATEKEIHDKRVILRKVFPILAAYKMNPGKIRNGKKAFKLFGKLRDIQVQILKLESIERIPEITDYYVFLKEEELSLKEEVRKFGKKKKLVFPEIKTNSGVDKAKIVRKAEKSLYRIEKKIQVWSIDDAEYIHKIRIEFKKFRYRIEILANITYIAEEKLEKIRLYQDRLGEIQDYEVLIEGITKFYGKRNDDVSTDLFEEKQSLLIDEFEQDHEAFLAICKDIICLTNNVVGSNSEVICQVSEEPESKIEQEVSLNEPDASIKDEVADNADLVVLTDNEVVLDNELAVPIVGKVSSKKRNKRSTENVVQIDKDSDSSLAINPIEPKKE